MMKHKYNARSPHAPYEEFDSHARAGVRIVEGWPFRVHHYTGSMKTSTSRPERTVEMSQQRNRMKFHGNYDASATKWFPEFVELLQQNSSDDGVELAFRLTLNAHDDAYDESMAIKHRVDVLKEEVSPLYVWDNPLTRQKKARKARQEIYHYKCFGRHMYGEENLSCFVEFLLDPNAMSLNFPMLKSHFSGEMPPFVLCVMEFYLYPIRLRCKRHYSLDSKKNSNWLVHSSHPEL